MRTSIYRYGISIAAVLGLAVHAHAAVSIESFGTIYSENFNAYDGTSTLPANFSDVNAATHTSSPNYSGIYDSSGSYNNANRIYALRDAVDDRAFGIKRGTASGGYFLNWEFVNNSGAPIPAFNVFWDFEQFSAATRATRISANYNPAGSGFTTAGITGVNQQDAVLRTGESDHNIAPRLSTSNSFSIDLVQPLLPGETIIFGWQFLNGAGSGANAHVGLNNLGVQAIPEPAALGLLGLAGLMLIRRRR